MLNTIYANTTQFNQLLNAIQGGDTTAIVTALNDIKDSIDNISGGGSPIEIDSTQWQDLLNEIDKGDTTALTTVLTAISGTLAQMKLALDSVVINNNQWNALITAISRSIVTADVTQNSTQWNNLLNAFQSVGIEQNTTQWNNLLNAFQSVGIEQNTTQWNDLLNAIQSQQITFNLSNINTDNTNNNSLFNFTNLTSILNLIYNTLFTTDTNIIKWTKVTTFSQFDVYCFKLGIIKILFIDTAKNNISSGWQTGGVGTLPNGYECILDPQLNENKTLRNGVQMTITVNSNAVLNINPTASITSGTQIRCIFIYI